MDEQKKIPDREALTKEIHMYRLIFDNLHGGALVTDPTGIITHINRQYCDFLGVDHDDVVGRHCTEILSNSRMHVVARTGKPEINITMRIKDQDILVQRIPIKENGRVTAVLGIVMFHDVRQLGSLARKFSLLESKVRLYEEELRSIRSTRYTFESIVGNNRAMRRLKKEALVATGNAFPVLITGESGTGKELFAQAIHQASARNLHPFIHLNCSAIPRDLIESELFGYDRGAFTGARSGGKPGKFELAHQGTIFLDEIGELPLDMQPKLLRVLEERAFERVGGTSVIHSDFRLITATNVKLEEMIANKRFRRDLFYRINVIHLHIPPLRERRDDILPIAEKLLSKISDETGYHRVEIGKEAGEILMGHDWPGNVRELSNVLERTLASMGGTAITAEDLPYHIGRSVAKGTAPGTSSLKDTVARAEEEVIRHTLKKTGYNKSLAARTLGIHRTLLYKKMEKYRIPATPDR